MKKIQILILCFLLTGAIQAQSTPTVTLTIDDIKRSADFLPKHKSKLPTKAVLRLEKFYEADDGSIIAIRQIGDKIYAIADRYDRRFSSVWTGTVTQTGIKVNYHYIPKGKAKGNGTVFFKKSGATMDKLVLKPSLRDLASPSTKKIFNFKTMTAIDKLPTKLPINDRAWYRGNTSSNLTGRYKVDNVGRDYILDLGKKIIMYSVGGRETSHTRPQFATLFIGDRNGRNIKGYYVDLPYGHTDGMGKAAFKLVGQHYLRASYDHFYYGVQRVRQLDDIKEILK